ncbi:glycosyltransferase family 9 protein [Marivirga arenosa]|uniref:Glycosyltransferase family 9 protein n=1 Tax=Marivirga arenosa TaxID=3059076 RepID=A0AA51X4V3_9BACT|nr:glycosyltransferase family 9 protein [Marivirga sp. BKB1-2]WNB17131.1 glycosyltransferase family 9 protein [Marivirga sp. BKB1-2]
MKKLNKVLILRFSSIGDIVLTTPVIRAIKLQLDDVEVHYATKRAYANILENNHYVDKVHVLEDKIDDLIQDLKAENYDYIVDLHNNLRSRIIKLRLNKPSKSFQKLNFEKWLMVNLKVDKLPNKHIVDRYMEAASELGVKKDQFGLDYFIPEKDEIEKEWLPESHQKEYVAYVIGAQHNTKKLPFKRMVELCDKINKPIVLVGGPDDAKMGERVEDFFKKTDFSEPYEEKLTELGKKAKVFNSCGKFNLNQSASIVKGATYVFTHDTGLMHIAAAFKKNIFCIWGNTIPMFGMYPYKTKFTILENNKVNCRPCSKIGYQKCPKGHFNCMNKIVFDFWLP